jgi:hypothetical protein
MRTAQYSATPEWMKNKRDDNEPEILRRMQELGCAWRACSRHEGHDGWVLYGEMWYCVEIKNPKKRWELTPAEKKMQIWVRLNGGKYYILQFPEDVDKMLDDEL